MKRGEIYYITPNYSEIGSEQRAGRPAVIVSNNNNNNCSEVVEVAYMTTQPKTDLPTHVITRSTVHPSTILCEQICSVSTQRLGSYIGTLTAEEIKALDTALAISLGLNIDPPKQVVVREPTEEEMAKIRESVRKELEAVKVADTGVKPPKPTEKPAQDSLVIKTKTERDLYKKFSEELLEILKGGTKAGGNT